MQESSYFYFSFALKLMQCIIKHTEGLDEKVRTSSLQGVKVWPHTKKKVGTFNIRNMLN